MISSKYVLRLALGTLFLAMASVVVAQDYRSALSRQNLPLFDAVIWLSQSIV